MVGARGAMQYVAFLLHIPGCIKFRESSETYLLSLRLHVAFPSGFIGGEMPPSANLIFNRCSGFVSQYYVKEPELEGRRQSMFDGIINE